LVVRIETFDEKGESNVPRDRVAFKSSAQQAIVTVNRYTLSKTCPTQILYELACLMCNFRCLQ